MLVEISPTDRIAIWNLTSSLLSAELSAFKARSEPPPPDVALRAFQAAVAAYMSINALARAPEGIAIPGTPATYLINPTLSEIHQLEVALQGPSTIRTGTP